MRFWLAPFLFLVSLMLPKIVFAAPSITIVSIPDSLMIGNSTTVSASASGLIANNTYNIKIRLGINTSELTKGQTNNTANSSPDDWLSDTSSWSKFPIITADSDGNWNGNIVVRPADGASVGSNVAILRLHKIDGGQNYDSSSVNINIVASPTPVPTNTPGPTNTPSPSNTPVPSSTPRPTATPKPSNTPRTSPTSVVELIPSIGETEIVNASIDSQGRLLDLDEAPPPDTAAVLGETTEKKKNVIPIILIVVGGLGLGISLLLLFKHARSRDYQENDG
jgi:hypothetical protein